jgi:hypothetical protein
MHDFATLFLDKTRLLTIFKGFALTYLLFLVLRLSISYIAKFGYTKWPMSFMLQIKKRFTFENACYTFAATYWLHSTIQYFLWFYAPAH